VDGCNAVWYHEIAELLHQRLVELEITAGGGAHSVEHDRLGAGVDHLLQGDVFGGGEKVAAGDDAIDAADVDDGVGLGGGLRLNGAAGGGEVEVDGVRNGGQALAHEQHAAHESEQTVVPPVVPTGT
jgi:hypothetical protein